MKDSVRAHEPSQSQQGGDRLLVPTGIGILDQALGGGFQPGSAILFMAEEGAGGTEFALLAARHAHVHRGRTTRWVSALRSRERIEREARILLADNHAADGLDAHAPIPAASSQSLTIMLDGLAVGDMLVLESAETLGDATDEPNLKRTWRQLGDEADQKGVVILLIHSPGTLPRSLETGLAQSADAVFRFRWQEGGSTRRRTLVIEKLRGLAPGLDAEETPVFEVALDRGRGFTISRDRSVL